MYPPHARSRWAGWPGIISSTGQPILNPNKVKIMDHISANSNICIACHECCKWLTFTITTTDLELADKHIEFYVARGCRVKTKSEGARLIEITIMVPHVCPQMHVPKNPFELIAEGTCKIYKDRPRVCRAYDGRWDPHIQDACQLPSFAPDVCPFCEAVDPLETCIAKGESTCYSCGKVINLPSVGMMPKKAQKPAMEDDDG